MRTKVIEIIDEIGVDALNLGIIAPLSNEAAKVQAELIEYANKHNLNILEVLNTVDLGAI
jgi:hypothetical protein